MTTCQSMCDIENVMDNASVKGDVIGRGNENVIHVDEDHIGVLELQVS
jgi:hypothetical protein